jgi:hypothetical protein
MKLTVRRRLAHARINISGDTAASHEEVSLSLRAHPD